MKKKILVADDSITIQKVVELTFAQDKYQVTCAGTGSQAIQRIDADCPDIALLDAVMPDRSGYDVCAHIKGNPATAWVPVVLLSGAFEPYDEQKAKQTGAESHIRKPFESRSLVSRVEELLRAHPRPGTQPEPEPAPAPAPPREAPPTPQAARVATSELFTQVPPGPAAKSAPPAPAERPRPAPAQPAPAQSAPTPQPARNAVPPRPAPGGASPATPPPPEVERAVREAVAGIAERIVREVAWEVIPDLAEAIIKRRIQELEQEAEQVDAE